MSKKLPGELTLEDMTQEELVELCKNYLLGNPQQLATLRWHALQRRAKDIRDKACADMDKLKNDSTLNGHMRFLEASRRFDEGMALDDEAGVYFKFLTDPR